MDLCVVSINIFTNQIQSVAALLKKMGAITQRPQLYTCPPLGLQTQQTVLFSTLNPQKN